jgi:hypothetical protein
MPRGHYAAAMLDRIPLLQQFSRLYWNQMGPDVHGTIERAFRQFLDDAARTPDGGESLRRALYAELMIILDSSDYDRWVKVNRTNVETIEVVGGRFILPEQVRPLMTILDESFEADA